MRTAFFTHLLIILNLQKMIGQEYSQYPRFIDSVNTQVSCRFEYVTCKVEWLTVMFNDPMDQYFGTHLKSKEDSKIYKILIGAKKLYKLLYPERGHPDYRLLYISVGKMLQYDTIIVNNVNIMNILKEHQVNEELLSEINKRSFLENAKTAIWQSDSSDTWMISNELGYYLDRLHHSISIVYLNGLGPFSTIQFNFACSNPMGWGYLFSDENQRKIFTYKYFDNGVLEEAKFEGEWDEE